MIPAFHKILLCLLVSAVLSACADPDTDIALDAEQWPSELTAPIRAATFSMTRKHLPGIARGEFSAPHKGFDFIDGVSGRPLASDEPILSVADGEIVRIDHHYEPPQPSTLQFWAGLTDEKGLAGDHARNQLHGRQVWIRHESGHVSRYSHLSRVHPELAPGDPVEQGQAIGLIGHSGIPPTKDQPEPQSRLHFQLWTADGTRYLGKDLTALEIHRQVAELFSGPVLPRYARRVVESTRAGQPAPEVYPPEPLPDAAFEVNPPSEVARGNAFAAAITWTDSEFEAQDFFALLDNYTMGIIEAPGGAWILGAVPLDKASNELQLVVGAIDPLGRTLAGSQTVRALPPATTSEPLEVNQSIIQLYSKENREIEANALSEVTNQAIRRITPGWDQPFVPPMNGSVVGMFGQELSDGTQEPGHALTGVLILPHETTTVMSSNAGVVALVTELPIRGRTVAISHGGGIVSIHSRLDDINVQAGQEVTRGQQIGSIAMDGPIEDRLLMWEIHVAGTPTNPLNWVDRLLPASAHPNEPPQ